MTVTFVRSRHARRTTSSRDGSQVVASEVDPVVMEACLVDSLRAGAVTFGGSSAFVQLLVFLQAGVVETAMLNEVRTNRSNDGPNN